MRCHGEDSDSTARSAATVQHANLHSAGIRMVGKAPCVFQETLEIPLVAYNKFSVRLGGSQAVNEAQALHCIV